MIDGGRETLSGKQYLEVPVEDVLQDLRGMLKSCDEGRR